MTDSQGETWQSVLDELYRAELDPQLQSVLPTLEAHFSDPDRLAVTLASALGPDHQARLREALGAAARRCCGRELEVEVQPADSGGATARQLDLPLGGRAETEPDEQLRLNPTYTFDNFVVAPSNRLAHAACIAACDAPGRAYNPLFLHGTVGLGKSHLLQATCNRLLNRRGATRILYLSCESFVNQFITSVERGEIEQFRFRYRHLDVLAIDDIHFLADKERTQEEFFHTFNTLYQSQKQVILSSDSPPHEIPHLEERLISRFKWGLVARLDKPSFETRVAIVSRKARMRGLEMPDEVIRYVARMIDSNVRELEGAVVRLSAQSDLAHEPITVELARELLADALPHQPREITVPTIMNHVVRHFGVRISDLQGKRRSRSVALPRQICMHLARRLTNLSLGEIGGYFGGRDHTTVLHADRKIEEQSAGDADFKATVDRLAEDARGAEPAEEA